MSNQELAAALSRAESVLRRRPEMGLHDDAPATVRWTGGLSMAAHHPNGHQVQTNMPVELGGTGDQVSPGWLMRAGLAACAATCIRMLAARAGIELTHLEVRASSRSDTRAVLGMHEPSGDPVCAAPRDVELFVHIAAPAVAEDRLRELVQQACASSPVPCAIQQPIAIDLRIDIEPGTTSP
jgi:uncharacterized OsmC-like protein